MASFNLVEQPWIPCVSVSGRYESLNLRQVFEYANSISELTYSSPLVTVGLHRLLLAILYRSFDGPGSLDEWHKMWREGWDTAKLDAYLGSWRHRFDLFDSICPFYQTPYLENVKIHPVSILKEEAASGNNATLFDHSVSDFPDPICPAEAACYVIARQAYSLGGGVSKPFNLSDSTLTRGLTITIVGHNLFETLMLNLVRYNENAPMSRNGDDVPTWERDNLPEPDRKGSIPSGYIDYLTWQSRRIHLIPECSSPIVRWCQVQQNLKLRDDPLDPFKVYRNDKDRGFIPVGFREGKALWRDSQVLLQDADVASSSSRRPGAVNWLARIISLKGMEDDSVRPKYILEAVGIATDSGKAASVIFWRHERLPLPLKYLEDEELIDRLRRCTGVDREGKPRLERCHKGYGKGGGRCRSCQTPRRGAGILVAPRGPL